MSEPTVGNALTAPDELLPPGAICRLGTLRWRTGGTFTDLSVSPDGSRVAAASGNRLHVWDTATGMALVVPGRDPQPDGAVRRATLLDNHTVVVSSGFNTVGVWSIAEKRERRAVPITVGGSYEYAVCPAAATAATLQTDGSVAVWDLATGEQRCTLVEAPAWLSYLALSPDGTRLAAGHAGGLFLWDAVTGRRLAQLSTAMGVCLLPAFSEDGKTLAASTPGNGIALWDLASGTSRSLAIQGLFPRIRFSPDGRTLALLRSDCRLYTWNLAEERLVAEHHGLLRGWVGGIQYLRDGTLLVGIETAVIRCDGATGEPWSKADTAVTAVGFEGNGDRVRVARTDTVTVYDPRTGDAESHRAVVPTDEPLASRTRATHLPEATSADGTWRVRVETLPGKRPVPTLVAHETATDTEPWRQTIKGCAHLALAGDGRVVAYTVGTTVHVLDGAMGEPLARLRVLPQPSAVALSARGEWLAVGASDGTVTVYRVPDRKPVATWTGHVGAVQALAFSATGDRLVSGAADTTAMVWDMATVSASREKKPRRKPAAR